MLPRRTLVIIGLSTLILTNRNSGMAADHPTFIETAPANDSDAVPSKIVPVSEAVAQQLSVLHTNFCDGEASGDFNVALQNLAAEHALAKQHVDERHYILRRIDADSAWHSWNINLSEEQRSACRNAGEVFKVAVVAEESQNYPTACESFRKALSVFTELNAPSTVDLAVTQIHYSNSLNFAGKRHEAAEQAELALNTAISSDGKFSPVVASALRVQAAALASIGEYPQSLRKASRAIQISAACDPKFGTDELTANYYDSLVALCFNEFLAIKCHDRASRCLDELSKLRSKHKPSDTLKLCETMECEYSLFDAMNRHQEALAKAQEWSELSNRVFSSDDPDGQNADLAKCHTYLKLNEIEKARDIIKRLVKTKLQNSSSRAVEACQLTDVCPEVLVADHRYSDALSMLEPRIKATDETLWHADLNFRPILEAYSTALRQVGRGEEAKEVDDRIDSTEALLEKMRHEVEADPQLKFPWER